MMSNPRLLTIVLARFRHSVRRHWSALPGQQNAGRSGYYPIIGGGRQAKQGRRQRIKSGKGDPVCSQSIQTLILSLRGAAKAPGQDHGPRRASGRGMGWDVEFGGEKCCRQSFLFHFSLPEMIRRMMGMQTDWASRRPSMGSVVLLSIPYGGGDIVMFKNVSSTRLGMRKKSLASHRKQCHACAARGCRDPLVDDPFHHVLFRGAQ